MFLNDPPSTQADLKFTLLGFPVRVHPMFWFGTILLSINAPPKVAVMWVGAVFLCILAHELGHALVMRRYGFRPRIVLYAFGGLAIRDSGGQGRRLTHLNDIAISLAGPLAGFLLAALVFLAFRLSGYGEIELVPPFHWHVGLLPQVALADQPMLEYFINDVFFICVFWGLINLLPSIRWTAGRLPRTCGDVRAAQLPACVAVAVAVYGRIVDRLGPATGRLVRGDHVRLDRHGQPAGAAVDAAPLRAMIRIVGAVRSLSACFAALFFQELQETRRYSVAITEKTVQLQRSTQGVCEVVSTRCSEGSTWHEPPQSVVGFFQAAREQPFVVDVVIESRHEPFGRRSSPWPRRQLRRKSPRRLRPRRSRRRPPRPPP